ncbi:MAG: 4Fe-4S binding protein [Anaerolineales bacterium]|jgi:Fe-S-cluster-containing hydrogenase component 2
MLRIDRTECMGCGACLDVCPESALYLVEGKAQVDASRCTECGACVEVCPAEAIGLEREPVTVARPVGIPAKVGEKGEPAVRQAAPLAGLGVTFLAQHLMPRAAEAMVSWIERSLASPVDDRSSAPVRPRPALRGGRGGRGRRRRRRSRLSDSA